MGPIRAITLYDLVKYWNSFLEIIPLILRFLVLNRTNYLMSNACSRRCASACLFYASCAFFKLTATFFHISYIFSMYSLILSIEIAFVDYPVNLSAGEESFVPYTISCGDILVLSCT